MGEPRRVRVESLLDEPELRIMVPDEDPLRSDFVTRTLESPKDQVGGVLI